MGLVQSFLRCAMYSFLNTIPQLTQLLKCGREVSNDVSYLSSTFLLFSDKYYSCSLLQKPWGLSLQGGKLRHCHGPPLLPFLLSRHQCTKDTISEDRSHKLPKAMSMRFQNKSWPLFYHTVTSKKEQLMGDKHLIFQKLPDKSPVFSPQSSPKVLGNKLMQI